MADLTGPRFLGGLPPTALPAQPTGGERLQLAPGTRVEVRLLELLGDRGIRLRLDPAPAGASAPALLRARVSGPVVTAQLAGALPPTVAEGLPGRGGGLPMLAEVTRTEPRLEVRLLPLSPATGASRPVRAAGTDNTAAQWLGQQIRQNLPAARPLAPGLQALLPAITESRRSDTPAMPTSTPLRDFPAVQRLLESLPAPAALTRPDTLQHHIRHSGLWLESMLVHATRDQAPTHQFHVDLKGQLQRAAEQLRHIPEVRPATSNATSSSPPGSTQALTGILEGLLKRVTTLQLQSLQSFAADDGGDGNRWSFELPFRSENGIHAIHGELHRQAAGADDGAAPPWSLVLTLDLNGLGPTRIAVASHGSGLNVHFTAREPATVTRLRDDLEYLQQRLQARELVVAHVAVRQGEVDTESPPAHHRPLLDEEA